MAIGWASSPKSGGQKSESKKTSREDMKKLMLMAALAALTGCATVDGIGRDISGGANRVNGWID